MFKIFILFLFLITLSLNADEKWISKHDIPHELYRDLYCPDSSNCYFFSLLDEKRTSYIYKSTDQGHTWDTIYTYTYPWKEYIRVGAGCVVDSLNIFMIYTDNFIIDKTTDGGKTFKRIELEFEIDGPKGWIRDMIMYDANRGIISSSNEFFYTIDGWETYKYFKKTNERWWQGYCSYPLDSANFAVSEDTDSCQWFRKLNIETGDYTSMFHLGMKTDDKETQRMISLDFLDEKVGFGVGGRYQSDSVLWGTDIIWKTTNGGLGWEIIYENEIQNTHSISRIDISSKGRIFAVGESGKAMESTDFGATWKYIETPIYMDYKLFDLNVKCAIAGQYVLVSAGGTGIWRYEDPSAVYDIPAGPDIRLWSSKGRLHIDCPAPGFSQNHISISDISGRIVHEQNISSESTIIDISSFAKAVYLYSISSGNRLLKSGSFIVGE